MKTTYYSSPAGQTEPRNNHLLAALPAADYQHLLPYLRLVPLKLGQSIYESDEPSTYVYFPTTSIVSLLYTMEDGFSADIAITGNEGVVGISVFMGGDSTTSYATVLSEGEAYRLKADIVKREFKKCGVFNQLSLRYTQALMTQMLQTAVCYQHHIIEQQLCRWLLMSLDRLNSSELTMTQELISHMMGTRREGVTAAAGKLRSAGLIEYHRGRITVLDRPALEGWVCECYAVVKREYDRLLVSGSIPICPREIGSVTNENHLSPTPISAISTVS